MMLLSYHEDNIPSREFKSIDLLDSWLALNPMDGEFSLLRISRVITPSADN